jgi:uncharacterized protein (DUF58 family)
MSDRSRIPAAFGRIPAAGHPSLRAHTALPGWLRRRLPRWLPDEGFLWLAGAAALLLTGWVKGIGLILLLGWVMLALFALNAALGRRGVRGLCGRRRLDGPAFAGEPVVRVIELTHGGRHAAVGCRVAESGPDHAIDWRVPRLAPGAADHLRQELRPARRGRYACSPLRAWSRHPFGLVERAAELAPAEELLVLPRRGRLHGDRARLWLDQETRSDGRNRRLMRAGPAHAADLAGLRPFRTGDSPRWIHWRTSARRNELIVREFADAQVRHLLAVVDPSADPAAPRRLEAVVSLAATLCWEWCRQPGDRLDVVIAGAEPARFARVTDRDRALPALAALAILVGGPPTDPTRLERLLGGSDEPFVLLLSARPDGPLLALLRRRFRRPVVTLDGLTATEFYEPPTGGGGQGAGGRAIPLPPKRRRGLS